MTDNENFDINELMEQAKQMQEQVAAAQEVQARQVITGTAGGEQVVIQVTGTGDFQSVKISPEVIESKDGEMVEDLVLTALRDATNQINEMQEATINAMDMPNLDNLLGEE